jgi:hypothetical protein
VVSAMICAELKAAQSSVPSSEMVRVDSDAICAVVRLEIDVAMPELR